MCTKGCIEFGWLSVEQGSYFESYAVLAITIHISGKEGVTPAHTTWLVVSSKNSVAVPLTVVLTATFVYVHSHRPLKNMNHLHRFRFGNMHILHLGWRTTIIGTNLF